MKDHINLLSKRVLKFNALVLEDFKLNDLNIKEKSLACPGIKTRWLIQYLAEKKYLKTLESALKVKIDEYVEKNGKPGIPKIKTRDEAKGDSDINKIKRAINEQYEVIEFLEGVVKIVSSLNFDIKNSIDLVKIEN